MIKVLIVVGGSLALLLAIGHVARALSRRRPDPALNDPEIRRRMTHRMIADAPDERLRRQAESRRARADRFRQQAARIETREMELAPVDEIHRRA